MIKVRGTDMTECVASSHGLNIAEPQAAATRLRN
jgi:hypothetical protein